MESLGEGSWSLREPRRESLRECGRILMELSMESLGEAQLEPDETVQGVPGGVQPEPAGAVCGVPGGADGVELRLEVSPGRFLQRHGDVVHDVTCTEVRIPLGEMEQFFREVLVPH